MSDTHHTRTASEVAALRRNVDRLMRERDEAIAERDAYAARERYLLRAPLDPRIEHLLDQVHDPHEALDEIYRDQTARLREYAELAAAIGVCYVAEGHAPQPGPIEDLLSEARRLQGLARQAEDQSDILAEIAAELGCEDDWTDAPARIAAIRACVADMAAQGCRNLRRSDRTCAESPRLPCTVCRARALKELSDAK
ncbi:MAG: hypothetical protein ACYTAN_13765 [Planctomycetota bacterium]